MRLRFRRRPRPTTPTKRRSLHLPPPSLRHNHPDPAFSADPYANPYHYLTGQEWTKQLLPPGHPTLQGPRRRRRQVRRQRSRANDNNQGDSTESEFELIQPPSSPVVSESISVVNNTTQGGPITSNKVTRGKPNLFRLPAISPTQPPMSISRPSPAKDSAASKPVKRFGLFTKRVFGKPQDSSDGQDGGKSVLTKAARRSEESGPSVSASRQPEDRSVLHRHKSAPGTAPGRQQQSAGEGKAKTGAVPSPINGHQHPGTVHRSQDRTGLNNANEPKYFDVLDGNYLFDPRLHDDGPYQAALRVVGPPSDSRMPLGLSDNGHLHQYHERAMKSIGHLYRYPDAPDGVSLNLSPGQVLPRNFRRQAAKSNRLRNFLVAPLPLEEQQAPAPVVPPRHANYNQIPFHKGNAQKKARQPRPTHDNPLDGPPFDPGLVIGLAMMRAESSLVDDATPLTPAFPEDQQAAYKSEAMEDEVYDPYAPENIEHVQTPTSAQARNGGLLEHSTVSPTVMAMEISEVDALPHEGSAKRSSRLSLPVTPSLPYLHGHSPSTSLRLSLPNPSPANGDSEETLVHLEEDHGGLAETARPEESYTTALDGPAILLKNLAQDNETKSSALLPAIGAPHQHDDKLEAVPPVHPAMAQVLAPPVEQMPQSTEQTAAARYDKQLPPHPPSTPPLLPNPYDQSAGPEELVQHEVQSALSYPGQPPSRPLAMDPHAPAVRPVKQGREWRNSALQKAIQLSDLTAKSTSSHQSTTSTRANDGHTPANAAEPSSFKVVPQGMMSQRSGQGRPKNALIPRANTVTASTPRISRRDPVFSTDLSTRYPKPSPLSAPPASAPHDPSKKPYIIPQRPIQRRNSTSSSKRSSNLHTIQEDEDLPSTGSFERSQSRRLDPRLAQGLQRSQSSVQLRTMPATAIEIGQVYPQHLQNSAAGPVPEGQPPAYTPDPQAKRAPSAHSSSSGSSSERRRREQGREEDRSQGAGSQRDEHRAQRSQRDGHGEEHRSRLEGRDAHREENAALRQGFPAQAGQHYQQEQVMPMQQMYPSNQQGQPRWNEHGEPFQPRLMANEFPQPTNNVTSRPFDEDRSALRILHTLSGVPEGEERRAYHHPSNPQPPQDMRRPHNQVQYPQNYTIQDNSSSKPPSMSPTNMSSASARPPRHFVPAKLVMPEPLKKPGDAQPPTTIQAKHFNDIFGPRPTPTKRYGQRSRPVAMPRPGAQPVEPSYPHILPPVLQTDDRMEASGRKLKKRMSHVPPAPPPGMDIRPHVALKFDPLIVQQIQSPPSSSTEKVASRPRPIAEKQAKKVLSKKRTNL